jgi:hypothetical protein
MKTNLSTKCVECNTPTLLIALTKTCGADQPDVNRCPFAVPICDRCFDGDHEACTGDSCDYHREGGTGQYVLDRCCCGVYNELGVAS